MNRILYNEKTRVANQTKTSFWEDSCLWQEALTKKPFKNSISVAVLLTSRDSSAYFVE